MALIWRERTAGDGARRAFAGLTSRGVRRKFVGPDPAPIARDGGVA